VSTNTEEVRIDLSFVSCREAELEQIYFTHPLLDAPRHLVRGRNLMSRGDCYPFTWSLAVQAMSYLLLKTLAQGPDTVLCSTNYPFTRSLDFALSKKPLWLQDLFGLDSEGRSNALRFFRRYNPEGKRPGPILIGVNGSMLARESIRILVGGKECKSKVEVDKLAECIATRANITISVPVMHKTLESNIENAIESGEQEQQNFYLLMRNAIHGELSKSLKETRIFTSGDLKSSLESVINNPLFRRLAGKRAIDIGSILNVCTSQSRAGLANEHESNQILQNSLFRVRICAVTVGALSLFTYLKSRRKFQIEIINQFSTGGQVVDSVINRSGNDLADLCVCAAPSAGRLLASSMGSEYLPVMLMPRHSHRIMARKGAKTKIGDGDYYFLYEEPSGSLMYFEGLSQQRILDLRKVSLHHCEAEESLSVLYNSSDNTKSILWFPLQYLADRLCGAKLIDSDVSLLGENWIILLAHKSVSRDDQRLRLLVTELHNAWIDLITYEDMLKETIDEMLSDENYIKLLYRCTGLHLFQGTNLQMGLNFHPVA